MCGICGFWDTRDRAGDDEKVLKRMMDSLAHRGPDDEGVYRHEGLAFGHRRLKVIDLEGGCQPMTSRDGRFALVFNGEIYNFLEIRSRLEKAGRVFRTRSDTESLLQLYEEKGIHCLEELEGMFAFAVYDRQKKTLHLAVDGFGKKPLYYACEGGRVAFASEIRSLACHPAVSRKVDEVSLAQYLAFEYVPAPRSMLSGVRKLEAGTYLECDAAGARVGSYRFRYAPVLPAHEEGWRETLVSSLSSAVHKRLVSDVPLGVFLSGGLDSSTVVALMRALEPERNIKTFTIGFREPSFDESEHARFVSRTYRTEHITEYCSVGDMLGQHESILEHMDEPLADASFIPTYLLCKLARKHVTVALGGDGGDELFLGYPTFLAEELAQVLKKTPPFIVRVLGGAACRMPVSWKNLSPDFLAKQFFKGLPYPDEVRRQVWLGAFSDHECARVLSADLRPQAAHCFDPLIGTNAGRPASDPLESARDFYFRFYLQGDILVKTDRASMASALEVRSPFLDDRFVALMRSCPARVHCAGHVLKALFKKAVAGVLPPRVLKRGKKGFGIPIAQWIRGGLRGPFEETLSRERIRKDGFFDPDEVSRLLLEHVSGVKDNRKPLWTLYVFQKWKARCLGGV